MFAIYARLSQDKDGTETSTERQIADCRALADARGLQVAEVYRDTDYSGFDPKVVRPDYERMLSDIEAGVIKGIIVWKLDRLSRQPGQFERVLETLNKTGATLISVNDPADMTNPLGLAMLRIGMTFAALESQNISLRTRAAKAQVAKQGGFNGGMRPYGYEADGITLNPEEAGHIRWAVNAVLRGDSLALISRTWQEQGVKTVTGLDYWQPTNIKKILTSWRIAGFREHGDEVYPAQWEAIIDEETLMRVRTLLTGTIHKRTNVHKFLLMGLIYCSRCQQYMYSHYKDKDQKRRYVCQKRPGRLNCGKMSVLADPVEEAVWEILVRALEAGGLASTMAEIQEDDSRLQELVSGLHSEQTKLEQLAHDHYVEGTISRALFLDLQKSLQERIGAIQTEIEGMARHQALEGLGPGESLRDAFTSRPFLWKRTLLEGAISRVLIRPGTRGRFKAERIDIDWKV